MVSYYPPKGSDERRKVMDYQNKYMREHFRRRTVIFIKGRPEDEYLIEELTKIPSGSRSQFIKDAIYEKLIREKDKSGK